MASTPAAPPPAAAPTAPKAAYTPPDATAMTPAPAPQMAARPAPWEDMPPAAATGGDTAVLEAPVRQAAPQQAASAPQARQPAAEEDDLPPWVTEFSDDSAVAASSSHPYAPAPSAPQGAGQADDPQAIVMPVRAAPAPAKAPYEYVITPVTELHWDGNWPAVAAALPLRGTAQQLAMQAELVRCGIEGNAAVFTLRVPIETWRTPGNIDKLTAALSERFGRPVRVDSELGPVWYTASAEAQAYRAACQRAAEETVANDPFVNSLIRELDAWVVPSSIVPPQTGAPAAA
ncbi:hypothetical protein [Duganella lactea]|nr:hypothetical protein [Duganella lactea]